MKMRPLTLMTTAGEVTVEVPYCQNRETGEWSSPFRETCGLEPRQTTTPELERRLCLTATATFSYEHAARVCALWGSPIADDSTIQRHVQAAGLRAEATEQRRVRESNIPALREKMIEETKARLAKECPGGFSLLIMLDGWMARERGSEWGKKPAETAGDRVSWREMKTAIILRTDQRAENQTGRREVLEKAIVAHQGEWDVLAEKLHAEALRRGLEQAREVFVVADGGIWIWNLKECKFGRATGVLDFYHAMEHLYACARALFGENQKDEIERFVAPLRHQLRHGGEAGFLRILGDLKELMVGLDDGRREEVERQQRYFTEHADHLNYQAVESRGCPVGSGAMESTCAQLQGRLKRPGQFWTEQGKRRLLAIELADRNGDSNELWFYRRELE